MATTAMSKAEENALSVSYDVLGAHVELDLEFVKRYLVRGAADKVSNQEVVFFMNTCKMQGLNPLVNGEVYLIKFGEDPAQMVVGKDAYIRRAFENPDYLYKQDGITVRRGQDIVQKEGCCLYPGEELLGGWCRVHFNRNGKERTSFKEVSLSEYNKDRANWKTKPATMVNKVAISQCVRDAFPKDYEGVYSEDEMIASGAIPADYTVLDDKEKPPVEPEEDDPVISQEQKQALFTIIRQHFDPAEGNEVYKKLLADEGLKSGSPIPTSVYKRLMSAAIKATQEYKKADEAPGAEGQRESVSADEGGRTDENE